MDCRRVNIFIGEPNTGKSNILEAVGFLSHISHGDIKSFVRLESMMDLFYDHILENKINVTFDEKSFEITFENGDFRGIYIDEKNQRSSIFRYDYEARGSPGSLPVFPNSNSTDL